MNKINTVNDYRYACCVIIYHPQEDALLNIISLKNFDKVYVFDNTEGNINTHGSQIRSLNNVVFFHDTFNHGIGKRLNFICNLAINDGYTHLLTMDQDSSFDEKVLITYLNCITGHSLNQDVGMYGVNYGGAVNDVTNECKMSEVGFLITSGSVINLSLFKEIGGFDELFFIDHVDTDYCFKIRSRKYFCIRLDNILLDHKLGETIVRRSLINFKKSQRTVHSPARIFFIVRNYFLIRRRFKNEFPNDIRHLGHELRVHLKNNFLYGKPKFTIIKNTIKGYFAYLKIQASLKDK